MSEHTRSTNGKFYAPDAASGRDALQPLDRLTDQQRVELDALDHQLFATVHTGAETLDSDLIPAMQQALTQEQAAFLSEAKVYTIVQDLMSEIGPVATLIMVRIILQTQSDYPMRFALLQMVYDSISNELRHNPMQLHQLEPTEDRLSDRAVARGVHIMNSGLFTPDQAVDFTKVYTFIHQVMGRLNKRIAKLQRGTRRPKSS